MIEKDKWCVIMNVELLLVSSVVNSLNWFNMIIVFKSQGVYTRVYPK